LTTLAALELALSEQQHDQKYEQPNDREGDPAADAPPVAEGADQRL